MSNICFIGYQIISLKEMWHCHGVNWYCKKYTLYLQKYYMISFLRENTVFNFTRFYNSCFGLSLDQNFIHTIFSHRQLCNVWHINVSFYFFLLNFYFWAEISIQNIPLTVYNSKFWCKNAKSDIIECWIKIKKSILILITNENEDNRLKTSKK